MRIVWCKKGVRIVWVHPSYPSNVTLQSFLAVHPQDEPNFEGSEASAQCNLPMLNTQKYWRTMHERQKAHECTWLRKIDRWSLIDQGNKVFEIITDFRTHLWKEHYASADKKKVLLGRSFWIEQRTKFREGSDYSLTGFASEWCSFQKRGPKTAETSNNFSP